MKNIFRKISVLNILLIGVIVSSFSFAVTAQTQPAAIVEDTAEVNTAHRLLAEVKAADRFINKLDSLYTIDLPVGIVAGDSRESEKYAIIISKITLRNGETFLDAYMAFTIPGTTKKIAFKGVEIPFSFNGGIQGDATLQLVSDFKVELTSTIDFIIKGDGLTTVTWDCRGFKEMQLTADVIFDSTVFIPENPDGSLKGTALKTTIQTNLTDWNNFMVGLSVEPFQLKQLKGVGFSITNAVLDMSDFQNPAAISFTPNYQSDYFIDGDPRIWQGVYIQEAQIRMPPQFRKKNSSELEADSILLANMDPEQANATVLPDSVLAGRLTFYAQNMLIDELGFTSKLGVTDLLMLDEGDMAGWSFSVKNLNIDIQASRLVSGTFNGQIRIPQFKQNSLFNYNAIIGLNDTYSFNVSITDSIELAIWSSKLRIEPNSAINIMVQNQKFLPSLYLNGTLTLNAPTSKDDTTSSKLAIATIPFQGMRIQTIEPYFSVEAISFGTEQNMFSKFPVSISEIGFESAGNRVGIKFGLVVNFVGESDGGFGGEGVFTVWGKHEDSRWKYDGVEVDKIAVDISKPGAFKLHGEVLFIRGDQIYGNGFRGELDAEFASFGMKATALFGNVNGYRYWFADALVSISAGIPAGPVSIYGFGGGAYYHMKQAGVGTGVQGTEIGKSTSGIIYAPDKLSGLGIKASVKFGLSGGENAFNGDVEFGISFTTSGGLNQISFKGNAYFATNNFAVSTSGIMEKAKFIMENTSGEVQIPKEAESSQLYGNVSMLYDHPNKSFHCTFNIYANIAGGLIKGVGPGGLAGWGVIHFDPEDWYIQLGTPDNPNGINVMNLAKMTNYFMAGKSVPELPPPPDQVLQSLGQNGEEYSTQRNTAALGNGSGFALGAAFSFDTGERTFLIFYGRFGCGLGFDILMKNYGDLQCEGRDGPIGISGWYAQGQAYAWIVMAVGIKVDLPFISGRFAILEMDVAALLQAKAPNPFWMKGEVGGHYNILNGLVDGQCHFEFEIGEQCQIATASPFGVPVIQQIKPVDNEGDVSVFTTPQVLFNMPVDEVIEFENEYGITKKYRIVLGQMKVATADGQRIQGTLTWNDRHDVLVFKSHDILPGEASVNVFTDITFEEFKNGGWFPVSKNGALATESKEVTFITGQQPDYIPQENVSYSYPQYRSFNYYKAEATTNYIKLNMGQPYLFQPGSEWIQKARIATVNGGQAHYVNYSYDAANTQVNVTIPQSISNNTIYSFKLVNLPANTAGAVDENVTRETETRVVGTESMSTDVIVSYQNAEESRSELQEKVIYTMEFRTSQYNTFTAKMEGVSCTDGVSWELYPLVHSLTVNIYGERFDNYEVVNLEAGAMISCKPVLSETQWFTTYVQPYINLSSANLNAIGAQPFTMDHLTSYLFETAGTRRLSQEEVDAGVASETGTVSGMKNYIAKYSCEYMYYLMNKVANTYVNKPIPSGELQKLFNADFRPLVYGNYPVNVNYTLPGANVPNRIKKHVIRFVD